MTTEIDTTSTERAPRATLPEQPGEQLNPPPPASTGHFGFGQTPREAYRAAHRAQRLAQHDTASLLRERAGLRRNLEAAERKIASDAVQLVAAWDENARLKQRIAELETQLANRHDRISALELRVAELNDAVQQKSEYIASLETQLQRAPLPDKEAAVLTLAYLRAWLTNAPLGDIQRDGMDVLLALAQPWHRRPAAWNGVVRAVRRMGITVGVTPQEASRG